MSRDRIEELTRQIDAAKLAMKPLEDERTALWRAEEEAIAGRVEALTQRAEGEPFTLDDLRFSETAKCLCGAGFAYPLNCSAWSSWH
jgi:hypothetical protein